MSFQVSAIEETDEEYTALNIALDTGKIDEKLQYYKDYVIYVKNWALNPPTPNGPLCQHIARNNTLYGNDKITWISVLW